MTNNTKWLPGMIIKIIISLVQISPYYICAARSSAHVPSSRASPWISVGRVRRYTAPCFGIWLIFPIVLPSAPIASSLTAIKWVHGHSQLSSSTIATVSISVARLLLMASVFIAKFITASVCCSSFQLARHSSSLSYWNLSFFIFSHKARVSHSHHQTCFANTLQLPFLLWFWNRDVMSALGQVQRLQA